MCSLHPKKKKTGDGQIVASEFVTLTEHILLTVWRIHTYQKQTGDGQIVASEFVSALAMLGRRITLVCVPN